MKVDRKVNVQHRVHWEDHVLQENKTAHSSTMNQDYGKLTHDYLSDNSQRENRPPEIKKRQPENQNEMFDRCHQVLLNNYSERKYTSSGCASPEKTRNIR